MAVCQSGQPIPDCTFCRRFIESVRMMACVICESRWEASRCRAKGVEKVDELGEKRQTTGLKPSLVGVVVGGPPLVWQT